MQGYITVRGSSVGEYEEKRSRFIAVLQPVSTEQEATDFIAAVRQQRWDARHNVYAYRLREGNIARFSDDGEPQGTAGMPVLEVLQGAELTDCVMVVTRYFGGVLLGTGGLVRAYTAAAKAAVESGVLLNMQAASVCSACCDYNQYGRVSALLADLGAADITAEFGENVAVQFVIKTADLPALIKKMTDLTAGRVKIEVKCEKFYPF